MQTIIPLNQPPNSKEWRKLLAVLRDDSAARQCTVIMNPACGPGPRRTWPDRALWLSLMAEIRAAGARLALYVRAQNAEVNGDPSKPGRWSYHRRTAKEILADIGIWREHFCAKLGLDNPLWWLDRHPASLEGLTWEEITAMYEALTGEHTIANCRAVPSQQFARECPARAICIHAGNGWPPSTEPTIAGKPTAIIACHAPGLMPNAKRSASYLYATPEDGGAEPYTTLSPHLPRILGLMV